MYKFVLCWRYLRTRYIALASIISVTLGVATMIVVNSVMAGFAHEMQDRMHEILSDLVFEARSLEGFPDAEWYSEQIRAVAGDSIVGLTPTVHVPAMLSFNYGGSWVTRPVQLVGVDTKTQKDAGDFGKYLQHSEHRESMDFQLKEKGYDAIDHTGGAHAVKRPAMAYAGWAHRRRIMHRRLTLEPPQPSDAPKVDNPFDLANQAEAKPEGAGKTIGHVDPFGAAQPPADVFDPTRQQRTGAVLGIALASYRPDEGGDEQFLILPGDDVKLTFPTAGTPPRAIDDTFTVVDFYECKMSEYDSSFVFVPIERLQELRGMVDPQTGVRYATAIQIKLKPGIDGDTIRDKLRAAIGPDGTKMFPPELFSISTWRDKQGPILAAVQMETAVLNVLLFLIIAVAGFGILAIFFMIVVEKTRDIGILKALGASGHGIMGIFLGYGLSLGIVGSGAGLVLGLLFVANINGIAKVLGAITGQEVFDPRIYYFYEIPTLVSPFTVTWIALGAMTIAVMASVLPARRAARLHPVEALRYE
jgi:lipoprotein-releasing system permease protein